MKPIVNLYKLGRMPYVKALSVQQVLFNALKRGVLLEQEQEQQQLRRQKTNNVSQQICQSVRQKQDMIQSVATTLKLSPHQQDATPTSSSSTSLSPRQNSLLLVEHEPVYTIGIRSKDYDEAFVIRLKEELDEHQLRADFVRTNRGGLITFHGPGQLVAYPIIYLGDFKDAIQNRSVKAYVHVLEATVIETLDRVGLPGAHTVRELPGVWLDDGARKIAFIGISCKRYVTMHGISINCDCDLTWFDHIISCGIKDKLITSVKEEMRSRPSYRASSHDQGCNLRPDVESLSKAFCLSFSQNFNCTLREYDKRHLV